MPQNFIGNSSVSRPSVDKPKAAASDNNEDRESRQRGKSNTTFVPLCGGTSVIIRRTVAGVLSGSAGILAMPPG
jgi:hypothetical protein